LFGDLTRVITALNFPNAETREHAKTRLLAHATTMEQELNTTPDWHQASEAFQQAFKNVLNLDLQPSELTDQEIVRAKRLMEEKYASPSWTKRI